MKRKLLGICSAILGLCVGAFCLQMGVNTALAETPEETTGDPVPKVYDCSQSYTFGTVVINTGTNKFAFTDTTYTEVKMMTGAFDKDADNYGLTDFDTWNNSTLTLTGHTSLSVVNWQWKFEKDFNAVTVLKSKVAGEIKFDFSPVSFVGWLENAKGILKIYRVRNDETTLLKEISANAEANFLTAETYNYTLDVQENDVVYYEVGSTAKDRNIQGVQDAKITITPSEMSDAVSLRYMNRMKNYVKNLGEDNYPAEDWTKIQNLLTHYTTGDYTTIEDLLDEYDATIAKMELIKPDPVLALCNRLTAKMQSLYTSLKQAYYSEAGWVTIKNTYDTFNTSAPTKETVEELQKLYDDSIAVIDAVVAVKQDIYYFDLAHKVNNAEMSWVSGDVCDLTLLTGTVDTAVVPFDTYTTTSDNAGLTIESVGSGPLLAGTWQWKATKDYAVIIAYKANVNCLIDIVCTRAASGDVMGWTDNCELNSYIVRKESAKKIRSVAGPGSDADFSGKYYLMTGDMLYVEYKANVKTGESRNIQTPFKTDAYMDSTAFDAEAYATQNHDLSAEVIAKIAEKKAALRTYFESLTQTAYSATNWLELEDSIAQFEVKCETDVYTVAEVETLYNTFYTKMQNIETLAQVAEKLAQKLDAYVAELQKHYDELLKNNQYTSDNLAALKALLEKGKKEIKACSGEAAGNNVKVAAIAEMDKIEKKNGGCDSSLEGNVALIALLLIGGAVVVMRRKNKSEF